MYGFTGACGQPPAASLQAVGPAVLGFAVWAATRGFIASCRSACLSPTRGLLLHVNPAGPGRPELAWLQLLWNLVYMRRACLCRRLVGRAALPGSPRVRKPGVSTPHWFGDSPPSTAICRKPSVRRTGTGRGVGELTGPLHQHGAKQPCVCVVVMLSARIWCAGRVEVR